MNAKLVRRNLSQLLSSIIMSQRGENVSVDTSRDLGEIPSTGEVEGKAEIEGSDRK